jgi:hypothetical protein
MGATCSRALAIQERKRMHIINMDFQVAVVGLNWINLAHNTEMLRALVNAVMNKRAI